MQTDLTNAILAGIQADAARIAADPAASDWTLPAVIRGRARLAAARARAGEVPANLRGWIDREPTNADRIRAHYLLADLEADGLLVRHRGPDGLRTTHLSLTAAGRLAAQNLSLPTVLENAMSTATRNHATPISILAEGLTTRRRPTTAAERLAEMKAAAAGDIAALDAIAQTDAGKIDAAAQRRANIGPAAARFVDNMQAALAAN